MLHYTHPKDVNRILCKFVARCEGRRHSVYDSDITGYNKNWDVSLVLVGPPSTIQRDGALMQVLAILECRDEYLDDPTGAISNIGSETTSSREGWQSCSYSSLPQQE